MSAAKVAVVTGASSGIGAATAGALAKRGFRVYLGARRVARLARVAGETGGVAIELDVTEAASVTRFVDAVAAEVDHVDLVVNNAGLALGLDALDSARDSDWITMWETNVLGVVRICRSCLPLLRAADSGHVINIGSGAAFEPYPGGAGYASTKHAVLAITRTLRLELSGEPIRVTEIDPGAVRTELPLVRFGSASAEAAAAYTGFEPLSPEDVADCIVFAVDRPSHVNVDQLVVRPLAQVNARTTAPR